MNRIKINLDLKIYLTEINSIVCLLGVVLITKLGSTRSFANLKLNKFAELMAEVQNWIFTTLCFHYHIVNLKLTENGLGVHRLNI